MSRSRYLRDERSAGRKLRDAVYVTEPTAVELEEDAKKLSRQIQRGLMVEIRRCKKNLAEVQKQMRIHRRDPEKLRTLARQSVQEQKAIDRLNRRHQDVGRQKTEVARYNAIGAEAELVRIRGMLTRQIAEEMNPARTMRQRQAMVRDQTVINVSEQYVRTASEGIYGGDEDEEDELTDELFQKACDMAGLQTGEAFTSATTVPHTERPSLQEDDTDAYLASRLSQLNTK